MRIKQLLEGYSRDKTLATYGSTIDKRVQNELLTRSAVTNLLKPLDSKVATPYSVLVLDYFEKIDPTNKNVWAPHMMRWYAEGQMRYLEDATKAIEPIKLVMKFKNRLTGFNPSRTTFSEMLDLGDELSDTKSSAEMAKEEELRMYSEGHAKLIGDDGSIKIVKLLDVEGAMYFGRGTRWCTAAREDNYFEDYNRNGPLFVIIFKGQQTKWQFHFESGSYMDEKDEDIAIPMTDDGVLDLDTANDPNSPFNTVMRKFAPYIEAKVKEYSRLGLTNEDEVAGIGHAVFKLPNPSMEAKIAAIDVAPSALRTYLTIGGKLSDIPKKIVENCLKHVPRFVENLDETAPRWIQEYLVQKSIDRTAHAVVYLKHLDEDLQMRLIDEGTPHAFSSLNPDVYTEKTLEAYLRAFPSRFSDLKCKVPYHLVELAVSLFPNNLESVINWVNDENLMMIALKKKPTLILDGFMKILAAGVADKSGGRARPLLTPEMQKVIVEQNPQLIFAIHNPTDEAKAIAARGKRNSMSGSRDAA